MKSEGGSGKREEKEWWSVKEMGDKHGWMTGVGVISECGKYRIAQAKIGCTSSDLISTF